ncbi:MAG: cytidine and deoxycytidylate deaminase zinc-binding region [bacterium P3]|nr:MAG: cytidine and deoxycytidylate deaminase zinc-binding region [bacterium P3]KWW40482.1 MAG: cytidine and deoxycytidylate deaminase zinc-binding region [bacterium F083]
MNLIDNPDIHYMEQALAEARQALAEGEIPVGAVVVSHDCILARCHNNTERLHDVTAHAEMMAITAAAELLGAKYLTDCTLYVTLEPCVMCAGALGWAQISRIVYGAADPRRGFSLTKGAVLHPKTVVTGGVMATECEQLLKDFFKLKRNK